MKANILHVVISLAVGFACLFSGLRAQAQAPRTWVGLELEAGRHGGVGIRGVVPGSPAAMTDLVAGDEVLSIDQLPVREPPELQRSVASRPLGKRLTLSVRNAAGTSRDVVLAPAARPSDTAVARQRLIDRPAPSFDLPRLEGTERDRLAMHHGHALLIDFWATWCGPCVRSLPHLGELRKRWMKKGLDVIGISTEEPALLRSAITEHAILHPILSDGNETVFRAFGILALPTLVLIDGQGVVRAVEVGGNLDAIEALLPSVLAKAPAK